MTYGSTTNRPAPHSAGSYFETRLRTASSVELTVILYDVLLDSLGRAAAAIEARDIEGRVRAINRAGSALSELRCSLDHEQGGEIAHSLDRLYSYAIGRIGGSEASRTVEVVRSLERLFSPLRSAWAEVASLTKAQPARTVVAEQAQGTLAGAGVSV